MTERQQATIGDALIFMTKGADVMLACLIVLGGIAAGAIWWNTNKSSLAEARSQVDRLNRQVNALQVQVAAVEQALDLEQQRVKEQEVTIADLGSKLNLALVKGAECRVPTQQ